MRPGLVEGSAVCRAIPDGLPSGHEGNGQARRGPIAASRKLAPERIPVGRPLRRRGSPNRPSTSGAPILCLYTCDRESVVNAYGPPFGYRVQRRRLSAPRLGSGAKPAHAVLEPHGRPSRYAFLVDRVLTAPSPKPLCCPT